MPKRDKFTSSEEYYCTLFHELAHSTKLEKRLNRKEPNHGGFGSEGYAREELTAELAATFLCAECNFERTLDNSASYIGHWLKALKNDKKLVVTAAGKAEKAVQWILNVHPKQTAAKEEEAAAVAA